MQPKSLPSSTALFLSFCSSVVFIVNSVAPTPSAVLSCTVDPTDGATFLNCVNTALEHTFNYPYGMTLSSDNKYAYILDTSNSAIVGCNVESGRLTGCVATFDFSSGPLSGFDDMGQVAYNNGILYVTNSPDPPNAVLACPVTGLVGDPNTCVSTLTPSNTQPYGIASDGASGLYLGQTGLFGRLWSHRLHGFR